MSRELFHVEPVVDYDEVRYPVGSEAVAHVEEELVEERPHMMVLLCAMLMVLFVGLGMVGCHARHDLAPDDPTPPEGDCDDGDLECLGGPHLAVCVDEQWAVESCDDRCGPEGWSNGCDAEATDPCQCEYDIVDGFMEECQPSDMHCDGNDIVTCDDGFFERESCDERCSELGLDYYSMGCNTDATDPCQCEYDLIGGVMAMCDEGDLYCDRAEEGVFSCDDGVDYTYHGCAEVCAEEGATSEGCDAAVTNNPCLCSLFGDGGGDE